jgi:phosphatidylserine/phosphatidylglycerophosphate/cardiolipin synthase-like enzyme
MSPPSPSQPDTDLKALLASSANIQSVYVDMERLFGSGVQHAKFIIIDQTNLYIGSANLGKSIQY